MAEQFNVSVQRASRVERGLNMTLFVMVRVANALGVEVAVFFEKPTGTVAPR